MVEFTGRCAWTTPVPSMRTLYPAAMWPAVGSAVFMIAALICAPVQGGCACLTSAAIPAVIGQAMEVPDMNAVRLPVPMPTDPALTPGAETSGFGAESGLRGPPDVKLAASL